MVEHLNDYLIVLEKVIPAAMKSDGITAEEIIGIGIDFTASTVLPTLSDGTLFCSLLEFESEPYTWIKLWSDHAA